MTLGRRRFPVWAPAVMIALIAPLAGAQTATLRGRVLTDSAERPIAGVVIAIDALQLETRSDSLGNFELRNIPPGVQFVTTRRIGWAGLATRVTFATGATVEADFLLTPTDAQPLPGVKVEAAKPVPPKLVDFEERRLSGAGGRFLTQADLERRAFATLADALRQLPSIEVRAGGVTGRDMFVVAGRMSLPSCALCGGASTGTMPCYAAVVLDGTMVYGAGGEGEPKFNINSLNPSHIAGIEYYVGPASMPARYNGTRHTCGLLMVWTK